MLQPESAPIEGLTPEQQEQMQKGNGKYNGEGLIICPDLPEVAEFVAQDYPKETTLIGPIKSQTVVHCASGPGVGKTQLAVALAMQLVTGTPFWHWDVPLRRSVLFLDGEMPAPRLQERLRAYPLPENREVFKVFNAVNWGATQGLPHPNLAETEWQAVLMAQGADLDVFIFDNVMSLVSVPGESMSSDGFWKPVHDFNLRARAAGKTVIWLDHVNAEGAPFGTRTKTWAADLVFTLESPPEHEAGDGCVFTLAFTKTRGLHGRDVEPFELRLVTDFDGSWKWRHRYSDEAVIAEVVDMLESGMSRRAIGKQLGCSVGKAQKLCTKAQKLIDGQA